MGAFLSPFFTMSLRYSAARYACVALLIDVAIERMVNRTGRSRAQRISATPIASRKSILGRPRYSTSRFQPIRNARAFRARAPIRNMKPNRTLAIDTMGLIFLVVSGDFIQEPHRGFAILTLWITTPLTAGIRHAIVVAYWHTFASLAAHRTLGKECAVALVESNLVHDYPLVMGNIGAFFWVITPVPNSLVPTKLTHTRHSNHRVKSTKGKVDGSGV
jgi:hypothetical protein